MLPVLDVPVFDVILPSNGKKIQMRPYLVKEQKILLMAQFSNSELDVFQAIRAVLESCIVTKDIHVGKLPRFDVEYLFVKLRAKSVSEVIDLSYRCPMKSPMGDGKDCPGIFKHSLDSEKLTVTKVNKKKQEISLTPEVGIKLKYPSFEVLEKYSARLMAKETQEGEEEVNELEQMFSLVYECTECVYNQSETYSEFTKDEFFQFLETMNDDQFSKIMAFFDDIPKLHYVIPFKCPVCGHSEEIVLASLVDFFG